MDLNSLVDNLLIPGVSIAEKIIRPLVVYVFLVGIVRFAGQRALGQMNTFDLVVLLMLSNTVQNAIIGDDNSLLGGLIGATTLIAVNYGVVHFLYHHDALDRKVEGQPVVLVRDGKMQAEGCHRAMLTPEELLAAVHRQGVASIEDCEQVILETSGTITVLPRRPTHQEAGTEQLLAQMARIESLLTQLVKTAPR